MALKDLQSKAARGAEVDAQRVAGPNAYRKKYNVFFNGTGKNTVLFPVALGKIRCFFQWPWEKYGVFAVPLGKYDVFPLAPEKIRCFI